MITDDKKWHYLALISVRTTNGYNRPIRSLSRLLNNNIKSYWRFLLFGLFTFISHR